MRAMPRSCLAASPWRNGAGRFCKRRWRTMASYKACEWPTSRYCSCDMSRYLAWHRAHDARRRTVQRVLSRSPVKLLVPQHPLQVRRHLLGSRHPAAQSASQPSRLLARHEASQKAATSCAANDKAIKRHRHGERLNNVQGRQRHRAALTLAVKRASGQRPVTMRTARTTTPRRTPRQRQRRQRQDDGRRQGQRPG